MWSQSSNMIQDNVESKFDVTYAHYNNKPVWKLRIPREYKEGVKSVFNCPWNPALKAWLIPFGSVWVSDVAVQSAVREIIYNIDMGDTYPGTNSSASAATRTPHAASFPADSRYVPLSSSHAVPSGSYKPTPVGSSYANLPQTRDTAHARPSIPHPASGTINVDDYFPFDDTEDGEIVFMTPPPRNIPAACRSYAEFKFNEIRALVPSKVELYVDSEKFSGGISVIAITGTIEEVRTYYDNRFANAPAVVQYQDYKQEENQSIDRSACVVFQFIL
jgi:hypothetical protein